MIERVNKKMYSNCLKLIKKTDNSNCFKVLFLKINQINIIYMYNLFRKL